jgi:hypothetical membrane protein
MTEKLVGPMKLSKNLLLGGIAGPLLFFVVVSILGYLKNDYEHITQFISELGETGGRFAYYMNYLGFMSAAALIFLFAITLWSRYSLSTLTKVATLLIGAFATGMFLAGVFSCDPTCLPLEPTLDHILHNLVSFVAFLSLIISTILWGLALRNKPGWSGFGIYSWATAAGATLFLISMIATAATRNGVGLFQRSFLALLFIWMACFAYQLWQHDPDWRSKVY